MRMRSEGLGQAALLWFGVLGAPAAWTLQHVAGYALTEARCDEVGRSGGHVDLDAWTIAITSAALAAAIAAGIAAVLTFRASRGVDEHDEPPRSRYYFLSVIGITIAPLFIAMMLMSGLGSVLLQECRQS